MKKFKDFIVEEKIQPGSKLRNTKTGIIVTVLGISGDRVKVREESGNEKVVRIGILQNIKWKLEEVLDLKSGSEEDAIRRAYKDFKKSKRKQFQGKTDAKLAKMAFAATKAARNESVLNEADYTSLDFDNYIDKIDADIQKAQIKLLDNVLKKHSKSIERKIKRYEWVQSSNLSSNFDSVHHAINNYTQELIFGPPTPFWLESKTQVHGGRIRSVEVVRGPNAEGDYLDPVLKVVGDKTWYMEMRQYRSLVLWKK